jgi:hypothetical protein
VGAGKLREEEEAPTTARSMAAVARTGVALENWL